MNSRPWVLENRVGKTVLTRSVGILRAERAELFPTAEHARFFMKYAKGDPKERLKKHGKEIKVDYLDYDWSLNGK